MHVPGMRHIGLSSQNRHCSGGPGQQRFEIAGQTACLSELRRSTGAGGQGRRRASLPAQVRNSDSSFVNPGLEKVGLLQVKNSRFFIFMQHPERRNIHFASVVRGCTVQAADQGPDRINRATGLIQVRRNKCANR